MKTEPMVETLIKVPNKNRVFVFELNEFNDSLLRKMCSTGKYPSLQKLIELKPIKTFTEDTYESDYLEPWVQWVSVHTGQPSKEHKIKHLGDISALKFEQMWEMASKNGIQSGVWGVLNGSRGTSTRSLFFVPDPWTFSEQAHPPELNGLVDFPRYVARNRTKFEPLKALRLATRMMSLFVRPHYLFEMLLHFPKVLLHMARNPKDPYIYFTLTEYLSGLLFLSYRAKYNPELSILFVNTLAHIQHYFWNNDNPTENHRFQYGFYFMDRLAERIFQSLQPGEVILCLNALSQKNTNSERPWVSYRPKEYMEFWEILGFQPRSVEALMSYDAIVFFDSADVAHAAMKKILSMTTNGQRLFLVENYPEDPTKLFCRLDYFDPVSELTTFEVNGKSYNFMEYFSKIATRTGKHIPFGIAYTSDFNAPDKLANHEICDWILTKLNVSTSPGDTPRALNSELSPKV
jgi:hypothetical protein